MKPHFITGRHSDVSRMSVLTGSFWHRLRRMVTHWSGRIPATGRTARAGDPVPRRVVSDSPASMLHCSA